MLSTGVWLSRNLDRAGSLSHAVNLRILNIGIGHDIPIMSLHYSLSLVSLALGELPLVDERHVVGVCAELGGHDAVSRHAVAPRPRQRLGVRLGAEAAPQPRQDLHQGLVGLALDLGSAV